MSVSINTSSDFNFYHPDFSLSLSLLGWQEILHQIWGGRRVWWDQQWIGVKMFACQAQHWTCPSPTWIPIWTFWPTFWPSTHRNQHIGTSLGRGPILLLQPFIQVQLHFRSKTFEIPTKGGFHNFSPLSSTKSVKLVIFEDCCTLKPADVECCIFDPRKMAIFSSVQKNPGHRYIFPISAAFPRSNLKERANYLHNLCSSKIGQEPDKRRMRAGFCNFPPNCQSPPPSPFHTLDTAPWQWMNESHVAGGWDSKPPWNKAKTPWRPVFSFN